MLLHGVFEQGCFTREAIRPGYEECAGNLASMKLHSLKLRIVANPWGFVDFIPLNFVERIIMHINFVLAELLFMLSCL